MKDSNETSKRLGIIALESHENYVRDLCLMAEKEYVVEVFTTREIYDRLIDELDSFCNSIEWELKSEKESHKSFLRRVEDHAETGFDILIGLPFYGTAFEYLDYARFSPDCPYYLYVFNSNGWIGRKIYPDWRLDHYLKYPMKKHHLKSVEKVLVEFDTIHDYIGDYLHQTPVETLTPAISDYDKQVEDSQSAGYTRPTDSITITIPGMIDENRREYRTALTAIERLPEEKKGKIEFILLGSPIGEYGDSVVTQTKKLEDEGVSTIVYNEWIPTEQFSKQLSRSDLIISPLKKSLRSDGFVELYGLSKGSGVISDAIRNGIPLFLPDWFEVPKQFASATAKFSGATSLNTLIERFVERKELYRSLQSGIDSAVENYTLQNQQQRLTEITDTTD